MSQVFDIVKTTNKNYAQVENMINELISNGAIIESVTPVVINSYKQTNSFSASETELLVFILYTQGENNNEE